VQVKFKEKESNKSWIEVFFDKHKK